MKAGSPRLERMAAKAGAMRPGGFGIERLHRGDALVFARAEVAGYEARVAEGLRTLRGYVRLFRQTGDRVLYKDNGIEFEKALIRLCAESLAKARANLRDKVAEEAAL